MPVSLLWPWTHSAGQVHHGYPLLMRLIHGGTPRGPLRGRSDRHAEIGEGTGACVPPGRAFGPSDGARLLVRRRVHWRPTVRKWGIGSAGDGVGEGVRDANRLNMAKLFISCKLFIACKSRLFISWIARVFLRVRNEFNAH